MTVHAVEESPVRAGALIAELLSLPSRVREAIRALGPESMSLEEAPGRWSIAQVVRHLADLDLVYAVRIRMALAESDPPLAPFEQDRWIESHGAVDVDEALSMIALLRRTTLRMLEGADAATLSRTALHPHYGTMTILAMLETLAAHDSRHLGQIARVRSKVAPGVPGDVARLDGTTAVRLADVTPRFNGKRIAIRDLWAHPRGAAKSLSVEIPAGEQWDSLDLHEPGPEEVFVARGTLVDDGAAYGEGTFIHYPAGTAHRPSSPDGCLLYVFYPEG